LDFLDDKIKIQINNKEQLIRDIRNDAFHFKREITMVDHQTLVAHRDWLLSKVMQIKTPIAWETKK